MSCQINNNSNYDVSEIEDLIQDLYSFSSSKMGFYKPPVLNLVSDDQNTSPLGKTAYYDPTTMEITIYVDGRHPKDIMRSFAHELVHHNQNQNGMFDEIQGESGDGYAQTNPHLRKMEKEAYLKGNMCFRDWEDGYKSSNPNILNERRIYKMSIKKWKNKELNGLLNERWGFSMNLDKLNESKEITHMCALEVTHKKTGKKGHPVKHTLTESGKISHYTVEFEDVIVENISVGNLDILVQEEHSHKRDDEKKHDKDKKIVSEDELDEESKPDFADIDGDGDKEESMKDAAKDKKKGSDDKSKKKAKKGEIPPQLRKHVKGKEEDTDDSDEQVDEIRMRAGGLGKTPKEETEAAKKVSPFNKKQNKPAKAKLKEAEGEISVGQRLQQVTAIRDALRQGIKNDTGINIPPEKMAGLIDMVIDAASKDSTARTLGYKKFSKVPPQGGNNDNGNSGAPAQVQEEELREAIKRIIKSKLNKKKK